jgi:hypothetical protein
MVRWCVSDENSWHKIEKYASTFVSPQKQHLTWEMNSVDCHDITTQEQLRNKQVAQIIKRYIAESTSKNQTSKIGKQEHRKRVCQKCRWWGRERSRPTAFVTGGGLGAFLLLLAIVSVSQKKNPSTATVIVAVTCVGKKKGIRMDL